MHYFFVFLPIHVSLSSFHHPCLVSRPHLLARMPYMGALASSSPLRSDSEAEDRERREDLGWGGAPWYRSIVFSFGGQGIKFFLLTQIFLDTKVSLDFFGSFWLAPHFPNHLSPQGAPLSLGSFDSPFAPWTPWRLRREDVPRDCQGSPGPQGVKEMVALASGLDLWSWKRSRSCQPGRRKHFPCICGAGPDQPARRWRSCWEDTVQSRWHSQETAWVFSCKRTMSKQTD